MSIVLLVHIKNDNQIHVFGTQIIWSIFIYNLHKDILSHNHPFYLDWGVSAIQVNIWILVAFIETMSFVLFTKVYAAFIHFIFAAVVYITEFTEPFLVHFCYVIIFLWFWVENDTQWFLIKTFFVHAIPERILNHSGTPQQIFITFVYLI